MTTAYFTGVYDVDLEILLNVEDSDLNALCQTSKYLYRLCQDDTFWQRRIARKISPLLVRKEAKYPSLTWKEWYFFWKKHNNALFLIERGKLTPSQAYIFISSSNDEDLPFGSEIYQTLDLALIKALEKKDNAYLSDLLKKFNRLYGDSFFSNYEFEIEEEIEIITPPSISTIGYVDVVITALLNGYHDIAREITTFITSYYMVSQENEKDLLLLVLKLGLNDEIQFYETYLRLFVEGALGSSQDPYFIEGLVKGGHLESAKAFYLKYNISWYDLLDVANISDDFARYLQSQMSFEEKHDFSKQMYYYQSSDLFDNTLTVLNNPDDITPKILGRINNQINNGKVQNIIIDYTDISLFVRFIREKRGSKDKVIAYLIGDAVGRGIVDLIFSIDFNDPYYSSEDVWNDILFYCYNLRNKGLYLYFITELANKIPDLFHEYINYPTEQSYEIFLLNNILISYDIEDLLTSNMYDLLKQIFLS